MTSPIRRLAVMDYDGANNQFLTDGSSMALSPECALCRLSCQALASRQPSTTIASSQARARTGGAPLRSAGRPRPLAAGRARVPRQPSGRARTTGSEPAWAMSAATAGSTSSARWERRAVSLRRYQHDTHSATAAVDQPSRRRVQTAYGAKPSAPSPSTAAKGMHAMIRTGRGSP